MPPSVSIGGLPHSEIVATLAERGVQLNALARTLLAHPAFQVSEACSTIDIADVAVRDLGLPQGATLEQVFECAAAHGLTLCPLELAVHLRLQFSHQPEGALGYSPTTGRAPPGSLTLAAHPVADIDGEQLGFYLRRIHGVLWLRGYRSPPEHHWDGGDRFVFCRSSPGTRAKP